jgi:hypothetical protein
VEWVHVVWDKLCCLAVVKTALYLLVNKKGGEILEHMNG